ncbi:MAG: Mov34/MPN/PAD-1 family protein [Rhodobacteraceae bacterium]|nr:Mov34/MPN/PAD-1 family protein [Paracoccaceae bacterium]
MTVWTCDRLGLQVSLAPSALEVLLGHRQLRWMDREAGGPLFSNSPGRYFAIDLASGPFPKDRRTRRGYIPHRPSVQADILQKHRLGLHLIGTWHTHPSARPTASPSDARSISNLYRESEHELDAFIMLIVGTSPEPATWELSAQGSFGKVVLTVESDRLRD